MYCDFNRMIRSTQVVCMFNCVHVQCMYYLGVPGIYTLYAWQLDVYKAAFFMFHDSYSSISNIVNKFKFI